MIKQETIQRIIDTARIDEVVSEFVSLRKRGTSLIGLCPFHNEKTPSFYVSPAKGIYKCFGCSKGGDSIGFIMEHEHYSYVEALRFLAQKYNIEIEETVVSPEYLAEQSEKEILYSITSFAQKFFTDTLHNTDEGRTIGLSYFKERGFTEETIEKFQLGYCTSKWDNFTNEALEHTYKHNHLLKSGLTIEKDGKYYDRFRERVIFPIQNLTGRVIGFGGRILSTDKTKAKYINSPETEIYHKSNVLYGISFAKSKIVSDDNCFLVEGYTDVISMHQAGITNVVSSSGTSLTTEQIRLIKKFTSNITIIYDGDPAGIKASFRGIGMVLEEGLNVRVLLLPEPEDPDSFVRKNRTSEVIEYIKQNTTNFILFKTNLLLKEADNDPVKKANIVNEIIEDISLIPNPVTRSFYIKDCSSLFNVPEQTLLSQLNKIITQKFKKKSSSYQPEISQDVSITEIPQPEQQLFVDYYDCEFQEKDIIKLILNLGNQHFKLKIPDEFGVFVYKEFQIASFVINNLFEDEIEFNNPLYQKIFYECSIRLEDKNFDIQKYFLNHTESEIRKFTIDMVSTPHALSKNWEEKKEIIFQNIYDADSLKLNEHVINTLYSLKLRKIELMINETNNKLKKSISDEEINNNLQELKELLKIRDEFCKKNNIIITH